MNVKHLKSNIIADFTGTVTVYNSQGSTQTVAATDLVRPSDWNSVHNNFFTFEGNTTGSSTLSGANIPVVGSGGVSVGGSAGSYIISGMTNPGWLTTAAQSNHSHGNPTLALTNLNGTTNSASNGFTLSLSAVAQSVQPVAASAANGSFNFSTLAFINSNGVSWSTSTDGIRATVKTDYLTTARASNDAVGLNTALTAGPLAWTVNSGGISLNAGSAAGTTSGFGGNLISGSMTHNTAGLNLSLNHPAWLTTAANSTHSHDMATTTTNGSLVVVATENSAGYTLAVPPFITTAALSDHSHGNPTLNLTNLSGTTASNSAGFTLSLSANAPGAAAEANWFNITGNTSGNTTASGSTIMLSAGNNVTNSGTNGSVIRIDAGGGAQTNQTIGGYFTNNTTGQSSSSTFDARSMSVSALGGVSAGMSGGMILVSGPSVSSLVAGMNASLSSNGSTVTINAMAPAISIGGNSTSAGGGYSNISSGTAILAGGNNITLSQNGATITISAGNAGGGTTVNGFAPEFLGREWLGGQFGQSSIWAQPMDVRLPFQFSSIVLPVNYSNASNSSNSVTLSIEVGIYTKNASTLSRLSSTSSSWAATNSGTVGSYSIYGGPRNLPIAWTGTLTEANYWLAILSKTTTGGGAGMTFSNYVGSNINSAYSGFWSSANNASNQARLGLGSWSVQSANLPASMAFSDIRGSAAVNLRPFIYQFVVSI